MLDYDLAHDIDCRFCAILLRLANLLDFDETRTPSVLFQFAANDEKSVQEWKKLMSSVGFVYPEAPSQVDLRYIAECHAPGEEYAKQVFLNWIDAELNNS